MVIFKNKNECLSGKERIWISDVMYGKEIEKKEGILDVIYKVY